MDNAGYVMAAYAVVFSVLVVYTVALVARLRRAERTVDHSASEPASASSVRATSQSLP